MTTKNDSRRMLVGAAFAACVITSLPGVALELRDIGKSWPDVQAALFEIIPGALAAAFGASRLRESPLLRKRLPSAFLMLAITFVMFVQSLFVLLGVAGSTTEGGAVLVAGLFVIVLLVAVQMALIGLTWFLLSALAKRLDRDDATSFHPDGRSAKWLAVAALVHVCIKGVSGGPVFFGLFAAVVALSLAVQTKEAMAMTLAGLAIPIGLGGQIYYRVHIAHLERLEALPLCEGDDNTGTLGAERQTGVLASHAQALPGVANAFAFSRSPYGDQELSLVVLPVGGGPIDPTLRKTIEASLANPDCVIDDKGTKPHVTVEDPKYVEIPVLASIHLAPGANADDVKKLVAQGLHDQLTPRVGLMLIRDRTARGLDLPWPIAGATSVVYKSGTDYLDSRIDQLDLGQVPTLGKVDITIEP